MNLIKELQSPFDDINIGSSTFKKIGIYFHYSLLNSFT